MAKTCLLNSIGKIKEEEKLYDDYQVGYACRKRNLYCLAGASIFIFHYVVKITSTNPWLFLTIKCALLRVFP